MNTKPATLEPIPIGLTSLNRLPIIDSIPALLEGPGSTWGTPKGIVDAGLFLWFVLRRIDLPLFRHEQPVAIEIFPETFHATFAGADSDVEVGVDRTNPRVDVPIQSLLGNGLLTSTCFTRRFVSVLIVQPKRHRPKHDIEALK